jgi:hypothetical protein
MISAFDLARGLEQQRLVENRGSGAGDRVRDGWLDNEKFGQQPEFEGILSQDTMQTFGGMKGQMRRNWE